MNMRLRRSGIMAVFLLLVFGLTSPDKSAWAGSPTKLNGSMVSGGNVSGSFRSSPDNSRVAYKADQDTDGVLELYSVPIGGGTPTKLNDSPGERGQCLLQLPDQPGGIHGQPGYGWCP